MRLHVQLLHQTNRALKFGFVIHGYQRVSHHFNSKKKALKLLASKLVSFLLSTDAAASAT
jgi:hypothetical protein